MEPLYTPGAGHLPADGQLPGREAVLERWGQTLDAINRAGRLCAEDTVLTGNRGIGKTVTMKVFARMAEQAGFVRLALQATPDTTLARSIQRAVEQQATAEDPRWRRALSGLQRVTGVSATVFGVGGSVSRAVDSPSSALAPGDYDGSALADALANLADDVAQHNDGRGGVLVCVDELQMADPRDIRTLGAMLNHLNNWRQDSHVAFAATALPSIDRAMIGPDLERPLISNPSRLFRLVPFQPTLEPWAVERALRAPAATRNAGWYGDAVELVAEVTGGYPAHLQALAATTWNAALGPMISRADVEAAIEPAQAEVNRLYMEPRWKNTSPLDKAYLTAVCLSGGQARSGQIAAMLGRPTTEVAKIRERLIQAGDLYPVRDGWVALVQRMFVGFAPYAYTTTEAEVAEVSTIREMGQRMVDYTDGRTERSVTTRDEIDAIVQRNRLGRSQRQERHLPTRPPTSTASMPQTKRSTSGS